MKEIQKKLKFKERIKNKILYVKINVVITKYFFIVYGFFNSFSQLNHFTVCYE